MRPEGGIADDLRLGQREVLDGLFKRFFIDGKRSLVVETPTGVGKTLIALEFVREFWRRRGRCMVLVVIPRRALAYNSGRNRLKTGMFLKGWDGALQDVAV
jgi:superfamily II DNA or RNA helicase